MYHPTITLHNEGMALSNSPSSCGSSWHKTATKVENPLGRLTQKAAPMATPSLKLCKASPISNIHAKETSEYGLGCSLVSECSW